MRIKILHSISLKPAALTERDAPESKKDELNHFFDRLTEKHKSR